MAPQQVTGIPFHQLDIARFDRGTTAQVSYGDDYRALNGNIGRDIEGPGLGRTPTVVLPIVLELEGRKVSSGSAHWISRKR
jgi:hypothetical protein